MNILEIMEDYLEVEANSEEKEKLKPYYLALENLFEINDKHSVFKLDFREMHIVSKDSSQFDKEYLLFVSKETTDVRTDYQMLLHNEDVWLGYDDDYSLPRVEFLKSEYLLDYIFEGDDWSLGNAEKKFNATHFRPKPTIDEMHRQALIEYHERELAKLNTSLD